MKRAIFLITMVGLLLVLSSCMVLKSQISDDDGSAAKVTPTPAAVFSALDVEYDAPYEAFVIDSETPLFTRDLSADVEALSEEVLEQTDTLDANEIVTVYGQDSTDEFKIVGTQRKIYGYIRTALLSNYDPTAMVKVAVEPEKMEKPNLLHQEAKLVDVSSVLTKAILMPVPMPTPTPAENKASETNHKTSPSPSPSVSPLPANIDGPLLYPALSSIDNPLKSVLVKRHTLLLDYETAKKLQAAEEKAAALGYHLKIYCGYASMTVFYKIYHAINDESLIPDPKNGTYYAQGIAVDLTLVDGKGVELKMPSTVYDYNNAVKTDSATSVGGSQNYQVLLGIMKEVGFEPFGEMWWQFYDTTRADLRVTNYDVDSENLILKAEKV